MAGDLRVQNLGLRTRDVLMLVPETQVDAIERCSGHNGTYGVKREYRDTSMKIGRPVIRRVADAGADHYASDCPMAGDRLRRAGVRQGTEASSQAVANGVWNMRRRDESAAPSYSFHASHQRPVVIQ